MAESGEARAFRIGTRGSPLALAQAHETARRLSKATGRPESGFEIVALSTRGDQVLDRALSEIGGKGLFTKEVDAALLDGRVDLAVHSMKDVQTTLASEIRLSAILPREDPRDGFVSLKVDRLDDLPPGAVVGTASLRRQAQVLAARPDLRVSIFRGNVQTRLKKLEAGEADATYLAMAGLNRLGSADVARSIPEPEAMLPACAQGAIGITVRSEDEEAYALVRQLNCARTELCVAAERAFLLTLDGDCRTPIAGHATLDATGAMTLAGEILAVDGSGRRSARLTGSVSDVAEAEALGRSVGEAVLADCDPEFLGRARGDTP